MIPWETEDEDRKKSRQGATVKTQEGCQTGADEQPRLRGEDENMHIHVSVLIRLPGSELAILVQSGLLRHREGRDMLGWAETGTYDAWLSVCPDSCTFRS